MNVLPQNFHATIKESTNLHVQYYIDAIIGSEFWVELNSPSILHCVADF